MAKSSYSMDSLSAPSDRFHMVYIIFCWLGIGTLLPWNFFISVSGYWMYKFRTVMNETVETTNTTSSSSSDLNDMQTNWSSHLAVASMVPNVTCLLLNAIFGHRCKTQPRLLISLSFVILLFGFTAAMTKVNTDSWQEMFYLVTLLSVVVININAAIFQGGLLGIAGKFPPRYMGGVFSGQAIGGIFASSTNILFLWLGDDVVGAAFACFIIAVAFLLTALVCYVVVTRSKFFQHFAQEGDDGKADDATVKMMSGGDAGRPSIPKRVNPLSILFRIIFYALAVFLVFAVTLACYPAIAAIVVSTDSGHPWNDVYFIPVTCFLLFNLGDYFGRLFAELLRWPRPGKFGMLFVFFLSIARFAFIPLFLFCNASPDNRNLTQVYFASDWAYIVIMALFSLSNGYLGSICMMSAPQICEPEEQQTAASIMVALLGIGLGVGSACSIGLVRLL